MYQAWWIISTLFPIELSRDITEISPLWELLPFNLSWSPIGSRQSNDWPIVAKHANMTSSRQYKCDARDNYIRIFYFTLNSWWLQCVRSARDPLNRWISISIASPAWAWLTPRRRWTSPIVDFARTSRSACSGPAAVPFFPDVHEQLVKTWSAPQSARPL